MAPPSAPPLPLKPSSKWRAVLALLPIRSTRVPLPQHSASVLPTSSSAPANLHPAIAHGCAGDGTYADRPLSARIATPSDAVAGNLDQYLHTFSKQAYSDDIQGRIRTLDVLCALCADHTSTAAADRCVAAGVVEIILNILTSSATQTCHGSCSPSPAVIVEESEKAIILLHLITTISKEGRAAALHRSTSIISILGKKLLRISEACTASAIAVLSTLCYAAHFRKALAGTAIPSKLVVVLQVASEEATKQRAGRLLRIITNV